MTLFSFLHIMLNKRQLFLSHLTIFKGIIQYVFVMYQTYFGALHYLIKKKTRKKSRKVRNQRSPLDIAGRFSHHNIYLSTCLSFNLYISFYLGFFHLPIFLSFFLFIFFSIYLSIYLFFYQTIFLSKFLSTFLSISLSNFLSKFLSI